MITHLQIAQIRAYISQKGITYVDVQMEIIDHVASGIEEKMSEDPNLNFDAALAETHASFGVFGFGGFEESIINGMRKKYWGILWKELMSFFSLKYIGLVFLGGFLIYQGLLFSGSEARVVVFFGIVVLTISTIAIMSKLNKKGYRKMMVYKVSASFLAFIGSTFSLIQLVFIKDIEVTLLGINIGIGILSVVLLFLIIYVISALNTAKIGMIESRLLMEKYQRLDLIS